MPRIQPVDPESAAGKTKELLEKVKAKAGRVPNILKTMAHSPAVLESYMVFSEAAAGSSLSPQLREQIALVVGQENGCNYCLAAHSAMGKMAGLSKEEISSSRKGESSDPKTKAALQFAQKLVKQRAEVTDEDVALLTQAGYSQGEVLEIVTVVVLNIFTNYFNHVVETEIDFPKVTD